MPPAPTSSTPAQPRLLSGAGGSTRTRTAPDTASFTATLPLHPPQTSQPRVAGPAERAPGLPRWVKGFVIGGVVLALGMPAAVLMSRSMLVQAALAEHSGSKAVMVCTSGRARAADASSITGWLFGGAYFSCGDWETREARQQREREQAEASYMARQRARQQR